MNTKIYIKYQEVNSNKELFASCIISESLETIEDATELLEFGSKYNDFIKDIVPLNYWDVYHIEDTDENESSYLIHDKEKFITKKEKLDNLKKETDEVILQTIKANKIADEAKLKNEKLLTELKKITKENEELLIEKYELSDIEAKWVNENWDLVTKNHTYFKPNPDSLRHLYAEENNTEVVKTPESFEKIKEIKEVSEYILLLDTKINPQLFKDYLIHLNSNNIKDWQLDEYENKRVILHQRLFQAFGGDRLKRDNGRGREISFAIEGLLSKVQKCPFCGGYKDGHGRCSDCETPLNIGLFLNNLNKYIKK